MVPAMAEIVAFGPRKELEADKLKVVFDALSLFCQKANDAIAKKPNTDLDWRDGKSQVRASVNSRRVSTFFNTVRDSASPQKDVEEMGGKLVEAVSETIDLLALHHSPEDIANIARLAFTLPPRVKASAITLEQKRTVLESLGLNRLAILLN